MLCLGKDIQCHAQGMHNITYLLKIKNQDQSAQAHLPWTVSQVFVFGKFFSEIVWICMG